MNILNHANINNYSCAKNTRRLVIIAIGLILILALLYSFKAVIGIGIYTHVDKAYYDYTNMLLKSKSNTYFGYLKPCLGFGCVNNPKVLLQIFSKTITYKNECELRYIDSKEWWNEHSIAYGNDVTFYEWIADPFKVGYKYTLDCQQLKYADSVPSNIPKPYYTDGLSHNEFDPRLINNINSNYKDSIGIILENGYLLPDKNNPIIMLNPQKSSISYFNKIIDNILIYNKDNAI